MSFIIKTIIKVATESTGTIIYKTHSLYPSMSISNSVGLKLYSDDLLLYKPIGI